MVVEGWYQLHCKLKVPFLVLRWIFLQTLLDAKRLCRSGWILNSMHTKCCMCDVACQKIFQGIENIKDTGNISRWIFSPFLTKALVVSHPVKACNAGRMLQASFPLACNFLYIDETPLVTCSCIKKNHECQILHEVKEEYGHIFVWESDDNLKAMRR